MKDLTNKNLNQNLNIHNYTPQEDTKNNDTVLGSVHAYGGSGKFDIDNDPDRPKDAIKFPRSRINFSQQKIQNLNSYFYHC